jgi:hypothetical protein
LGIFSEVANFELEGRGKGGGVEGEAVTHVFETFLAEDCVEESGDGVFVRHCVSFAETRQIEKYGDAIFWKREMNGERGGLLE